MFGNLFRFWRPHLEAHNENHDHDHEHREGTANPERVRALATGAALATSIDTSPAVLVEIYDYAHRYRDKGNRSA